MPTSRGPRGKGSVSATQETTTTIADSPLASVPARPWITILPQIPPLLPTSTKVLHTLIQAVSVVRQQLGHQGQEDWAVAAEFDTTYQCTIQNTGDINDAVPQFDRGTNLDRDLPARGPDQLREGTEAQKEGYGNPRRDGQSALGALVELEESDWEEVQIPRDTNDLYNGSEVYSMDSEPDNECLDV